jgi:rhodanese-related sulfurtransferase
MNSILRFAALLPLLAVACTQSGAAGRAGAVGKLSLDEVAGLITAGAVAIVDVNGPERYAKGHLPGAAWSAFDDVKPSALPSGKDRALVFYCANEMCSASEDAARQAASFGYSRVYVMLAGIYGWEKSGRAVERGR